MTFKPRSSLTEIELLELNSPYEGHDFAKLADGRGYTFYKKQDRTPESILKERSTESYFLWEEWIDYMEKNKRSNQAYEAVMLGLEKLEDRRTIQCKIKNAA